MRLRRTAPVNPLSEIEFIALMAMLAAMVAFSIDAMLPSLPEIGAELSPDAPNRAQLVLTSFVLGMGIGTLFAGPLSDRFGRKPVIIFGGVIYIVGATIAAIAPSLELILAARALQGVGAAAPRVVTIAIVRDIYGGRQMARTLSIVMLVFSLFPAIAPTIGAGIIALFGWRGVFGAFVVFAAICTTWLIVRQPETLQPGDRRPIEWQTLKSATAELFAHPSIRLSIWVQTLCLGILFSTLSSTQQIFDITYGHGHTFHWWFGGIALVSASASFLNAGLVMRLGMRALIKAVLAAEVGISVLMGAVMLLPVPEVVEFSVFLFWTTSVFFMAGMTLGNLNALGMEPVPHIAGMAASIMSSVATIGAVVIAAPLGLMFDGTALPLTIGTALCAAYAWVLTRRIRRDSDDA